MDFNFSRDYNPSFGYDYKKDMDKKTLLAAVDRFVNGQGNQAGTEALAEILVNMIENSLGAIVTAEQNTEINGYQIPKLTEEQILEVYNTIVAGKPCVITDKDGKMHFIPTQGDAINDVISIQIVYFDVMLVTYTDDGSITHKDF